MPRTRKPITGPSRRGGRHKPIPPKDQLNPWIAYYWHLGFSDPKIADHALDHFDRNNHGLSQKTVQRIRKEMGLKGTIQQAATFETITEIYKILRARFPTMGARRMVTVIRQDYSIRVSEKLVNDFLRAVEPEAVAERKRCRFKRRRFWSAGVMEYLSIDQHDKWGRFGLWLHIGLDPFPGRIAWLKVWWCNRNPRLLIHFYIEAARRVGGIPLLTMSDRGRENNGIANMHTVIRHRLDPSLRGTLQHRFCVRTTNIKPEAGWSQFRAQWAPGFEDLFDYGINGGLYSPSDPLENLVFRWLAIPWLQTEIDNWVRLYNSSTRRANKNKILPHGVPNLIHAKPERFNSKNFQIMISSEIFDELQQEWAPLDDPVFQLTPASFHVQADAHYTSLGRPAISKGTFWDVYADLLGCFRAGPVDQTLEQDFNLANLGADWDMELIEGLKEVRAGDEAVGDGVVLGLDGSYDEAEFTDSDGENSELEDNYADFTDNEE
ncbi:hypothetical protein LshimejAT787_0705730 [Lyophyllum shimeji]|uniref:Integrase core domain-containing protein n=1 Tax=Lyophyllum shimeji TaxID=47721 RepID=A0A9P3PQ94_LYOSH|nr:hypothetical protein LshimejAT787_0705730 [Lyophyllum shimeji]